MELKLWTSDKLKRPKHEEEDTKEFLQKMLNRLGVGFVRYGLADKRQNYMTRIIMEMKAYKRTGNAEHLYNIANYCVLESMTPENKKFHFDETAKSATRDKLGT